MLRKAGPPFPVADLAGVLILRMAGPPVPVAGVVMMSCLTMRASASAASRKETGIVGYNDCAKRKDVCGLTPLAFWKLTVDL